MYVSLQLRGSRKSLSCPGGHLAYTWNLEVQNLLWDSLEEGSKWWIGQNLKHLGKHQEKNSPGMVDPRPLEPPSCIYMFRNSNWISSKVDLCPLEHSFICQADAFPDRDERHGVNSHLHGRPEKTRGEVPIMRSNRTAVQDPVSSHQLISFNTPHSHTAGHGSDLSAYQPASP